MVLKVDERDRANHNPLGIQGVVVATNKSGTSAQIVCLAGLLSSNNKPVFFTAEEFGVLKNPTLPSKLKKIQEKVRTGTFESASQPRTSVANAHRVLYHNQTTGHGRCKCKDGVCSNHCGCRRKRIPCSSSCACKGKCENGKQVK